MSQKIECKNPGPRGKPQRAGLAILLLLIFIARAPIEAAPVVSRGSPEDAATYYFPDVVVNTTEGLVAPAGGVFNLQVLFREQTKVNLLPSSGTARMVGPATSNIIFDPTNFAEMDKSLCSVQLEWNGSGEEHVSIRNHPHRSQIYTINDTAAANESASGYLVYAVGSSDPNRQWAFWIQAEQIITTAPGTHLFSIRLDQREGEDPEANGVLIRAKAEGGQNFRFYAVQGGGSEKVLGANMTAQTWYHILITRADSSNFEIFREGVSLGKFLRAGSASENPDNLRIETADPGALLLNLDAVDSSYSPFYSPFRNTFRIGQFSFEGLTPGTYQFSLQAYSFSGGNIYVSQPLEITLRSPDNLRLISEATYATVWVSDGFRQTVPGFGTIETYISPGPRVFQIFYEESGVFLKNITANIGSEGITSVYLFMNESNTRLVSESPYLCQYSFAPVVNESQFLPADLAGPPVPAEWSTFGKYAAVLNSYFPDTVEEYTDPLPADEIKVIWNYTLGPVNAAQSVLFVFDDSLWDLNASGQLTLKNVFLDIMPPADPSLIWYVEHPFTSPYSMTLEIRGGNAPVSFQNLSWSSAAAAGVFSNLTLLWAKTIDFSDPDWATGWNESVSVSRFRYLIISKPTALISSFEIPPEEERTIGIPLRGLQMRFQYETFRDPFLTISPGSSRNLTIDADFANTQVFTATLTPASPIYLALFVNGSLDQTVYLPAEVASRVVFGPPEAARFRIVLQLTPIEERPASVLLADIRTVFPASAMPSFWVNPYGYLDLFLSEGDYTVFVSENGIPAAVSRVRINASANTVLFARNDVVRVQPLAINAELEPIPSENIRWEITRTEFRITRRFNATTPVFFADPGTNFTIIIRERVFGRIIGNFSIEAISSSQQDLVLPAELYRVRIKNAMTSDLYLRIDNGHLNISLFRGETAACFLPGGNFSYEYQDDGGAIVRGEFTVSSNQILMINSSLHRFWFSIAGPTGLGLDPGLLRFYLNGTRQALGQEVYAAGRFLGCELLDGFNQTALSVILDVRNYSLDTQNIVFYVPVLSFTIFNNYEIPVQLEFGTSAATEKIRITVLPKESITLQFLSMRTYTINCFAINGTFLQQIQFGLTEYKFLAIGPELQQGGPLTGIPVAAVGASVIYFAGAIGSLAYLSHSSYLRRRVPAAPAKGKAKIPQEPRGPGPNPAVSLSGPRRFPVKPRDRDGFDTRTRLLKKTARALR